MDRYFSVLFMLLILILFFITIFSCVCVSAPKVERVGDQSCEVSWEALPPMKGDPISYTLQSMLGNSEFKQVTLEAV